MQNIYMNKSDLELHKTLGTELRDSAVIDAKVQEAYKIIRKKSLADNGFRKNNVADNVKLRKIFITLGSVAAALCITCVFCVMNPVMAREIPILGSIFEKVADIYTFGKLPEESTVKLSEESTPEPPVEHTVKQPEDKEIRQTRDKAAVAKQGAASAEQEGVSVESGLVSTDGGITISIVEEYASNQAAYIGIKVENVQTFPEMVSLIDSGQQFIKARTTEDYSFSEGARRNRRYIEGQFVDEHTFLGVIRIDYDDICRWVVESDPQKADVQVPEMFTLKLEITEIASTLKDAEIPEEYAISDEAYEQMTQEEQTAYMDSIPKAWYGIEYESWHRAGTWQFTLPIRITDKKARTVEVGQYDDDGVGVESIEISTVELKVNTVIPDEKCFYTVVFDADGKEMKSTNSSNAGFARLIEEHNISEIFVYFCDLPTYFALEESREGTALTKEEVAHIARYQVSVPLSE